MVPWDINPCVSDWIDPSFRFEATSPAEAELDTLDIREITTDSFREPSLWLGLEEVQTLVLELGSLKPSSWMDGLVLIVIGGQELRASKPSVVLGV